MYKLKFVVSTLFLLSFFSCFTHSKNDKFKSKDVYLKSIESLSDTNRKEELVKDIDIIKTSLDNIKDIYIFVGFSFSSGEGTNKLLTKEAQPFTITPPEDNIEDFKKINSNLIYATQNLTEGMADFNFSSYDIDFNIIKRDDLKYKINGVYENGIKSKKSSNYLQTVDSLDVDVSYSYPTAFDTIIINKDVDSVLYKRQTIYIKSASDNNIEIEAPIDINIIGYNAMSRNGILIDQTSYSNFPITGFSPVVLKQINKAIDLMTKATQAQDKAQSLSYLKQIPDETFEKIALMIAFDEDFSKSKSDKTSKDEIEEIQNFKEKYGSLLAFTSQSIDLAFPADYKQVYLYVTSQTQKCDTNITVKVIRDNILPYYVFSDSTQTKYGIVDNKGKVIVPATYPNMTQSDTLYFKVKEKDKTSSFYLNPQTIKLEALPSDLTFIRRLNNDLAIFSNENRYAGILKNHKEELVPFKYDQFFIKGNILVAEGSKRGRNYYEFYTLDGKLLNLPQVDNIDYHESYPGIIIVSPNNKYGYINKDGVLTIPPKYRKLDFISNNLLSYQTDTYIKGYLDNRVYLSGIIEMNGNLKTQPIYYSIDPILNSRIEIQIYVDKGKYDSYILIGYANESGNIVIEPQFEYAENFHKGYALVIKDDIFMLINTDGVAVKKFEKDTYVRILENDDDENSDYLYKASNGEIFNYKGDKIK